MSHRIFIALQISANLQNKIANWSQKYSKLPVRWLAGKNLHITIIPPWYENNIDHVLEVLKNFNGSISARSKNHPDKFQLAFRSIAYGPSPSAPRLIWASGLTNRVLVNFKKNLQNHLLQNKILKRMENCPFLLLSR